MVSSKPAVVTKATRAPLRCSSVLVPTVVPCSKMTAPTGLTCASASAIACDGSPGVEKTFAMRSFPRSTQTQSVKVPPVSTAMRSSGCGVLGRDEAIIDGQGLGKRRFEHAPRLEPLEHLEGVE